MAIRRFKKPATLLAKKRTSLIKSYVERLTLSIHHKNCLRYKHFNLKPSLPTKLVFTLFRYVGVS